MNSSKVYVHVNADVDTMGQLIPRAFIWEDGRRYQIDRVKFIRPCNAAKAGGVGDRFTVVVNGRERYLYFERDAESTTSRVGKWFIERKD